MHLTGQNQHEQQNLGPIALLGASAMFIGTYMQVCIPAFKDSWFTGLWGLIYITPWIGIMVAFKRTGILGNSSFGKFMPAVLLVTLTLANISNLIRLFAAASKPAYFFYIDLFWSISHILMLTVGCLAISEGKLRGWKRYAPFLMGTWLPFALVTLALLGRTNAALFVGSMYNLVVVTFPAIVVRSLPDQQRVNNSA